jgi:hypothetical protein
MLQKSEAQFRKKLWTLEVAAYLDLGKSTLDKLRLTGGGPAYSRSVLGCKDRTSCAASLGCTEGVPSVEEEVAGRSNFPI